MIRDQLTWKFLVLVIGLMTFVAWVGFQTGALVGAMEARNVKPPVADFYTVAGETCFRGTYDETPDRAKWTEVRL